MTPEEKAKQKIDQWFTDAGWKVVDREDYEPTCTAVAIREGLLKGNIPSDCNVIISTIQRLFSFLKGEAIEDDDDDDNDNEPIEKVILPPNPNLPHDYFDMIIIDECHRSIYGNWQKVLEYFDTARLVGLTATPIPETMAFFNNNRIVNYTLEKSIVDGVNVDCRVYRIKTQATENGGAILEGEKVKKETRYTGEVKTICNKEGEPITYSMLKDLENKLKMANNHFTSKQYFNLWLGQNQREITDKQHEVIGRIVDYIASNGACTVKDIREDDATHAAQMIRAFGNMQKANEALQSLYTFVVLRKAA